MPKLSLQSRLLDPQKTTLASHLHCFQAVWTRAGNLVTLGQGPCLPGRRDNALGMVCQRGWGSREQAQCCSHCKTCFPTTDQSWLGWRHVFYQLKILEGNVKRLWSIQLQWQSATRHLAPPRGGNHCPRFIDKEAGPSQLALTILLLDLACPAWWPLNTWNTAGPNWEVFTCKTHTRSQRLRTTTTKEYKMPHWYIYIDYTLKW